MYVACLYVDCCDTLHDSVSLEDSVTGVDELDPHDVDDVMNVVFDCGHDHYEV